MSSIFNKKSNSKKDVQTLFNEELMKKSKNRKGTLVTAENEELADDDIDRIVNFLVDDLLPDVDNIANAYNAKVLAESKQKESKKFEGNLIENREDDLDGASSNASGHRVEDEQAEDSKMIELGTDTTDIEYLPRISSIIYNLRYNRSKGLKELGELFLDPNLTDSMKHRWFKKICESEVKEPHSPTSTAAAAVPTTFSFTPGPRRFKRN